ncbi:modification methylase [Psychrobacter sp. 72-O-c]|uniref:modification methylase n=1 Tax=Psychrobacter sp. 72-O-c TaxID=2774125 RepID=UPI00191914C4|nr:modification methylase [Psychrobacter sp. 72-O-c]
MNISFQDYRKNDIHGVSLYPATMIAPVQNMVMKSIFEVDKIKTVYDPYHGSGISLYEAIKIDENCEVYGFDINPLAHLLTYIKLKGVTKNIYNDVNAVKELIQCAPCTPLEFDNIGKWFRKDIIASLSEIRWSITQIKSKRNRLYFWSIFSKLVRKYSNTRSSTYKLHIKSSEDIAKVKNNVIEDFLTQIKLNAKKFDVRAKHVNLIKGDVLKLGNKIRPNSIDLTITSPPYGDNQTTVTYGQFSSLPLFWIDKKDLKLEGWELDNYSIIDRKSLGGSSRNQISQTGFSLIEPYLSKISKPKQRKVLNFFADYFLSLDHICNVTKKYIVMTLGNRTVDGINIDLTSITSKYLEIKGFDNLELLNRSIPNKRIPSIVSYHEGVPIHSMSKEYVIIHNKKQP